jgi:hypothetical protein
MKTTILVYEPLLEELDSAAELAEVTILGTKPSDTPGAVNVEVEYEDVQQLFDLGVLIRMSNLS